MVPPNSQLRMTRKIERVEDISLSDLRAALMGEGPMLLEGSGPAVRNGSRTSSPSR